MTMEDWLPTIMAQLGQPELKAQLLEVIESATRPTGCISTATTRARS